MENSAKVTSAQEYDLSNNADGSIDICFRQQVLDPSMTAIVILPVLFFTSCSGVFAVGNAYGIPGGIVVSILLIVAIFFASYVGLGYLNSKDARIRIIPGQGIEFGGRVLQIASIERIGTQAGNMGAKSFRVYALAGGEKKFITEYVTVAIAKAIQSEIQERLNKA
jgi:hypothetical protein